MNRKLLAVSIVTVLALASGGYLIWTNRTEAPASLVRRAMSISAKSILLSASLAASPASSSMKAPRSSKGQLLAELDARPYEETLALAKANRDQAQADLEKARRGSRIQEIARANASVHQASAAAAEAERNFTRQTSLATTGAASRRTLDAARSAATRPGRHWPLPSRNYHCARKAFARKTSRPPRPALPPPRPSSRRRTPRSPIPGWSRRQTA